MVEKISTRLREFVQQDTYLTQKMIVRINDILEGEFRALIANDRKSAVRFEGGVDPEPIAAADVIAIQILNWKCNDAAMLSNSGPLILDMSKKSKDRLRDPAL